VIDIHNAPCARLGVFSVVSTTFRGLFIEMKVWVKRMSGRFGHLVGNEKRGIYSFGRGGHPGTVFAQPNRPKTIPKRSKKSLNNVFLQ
jgi:hypothetical protein